MRTAFGISASLALAAPALAMAPPWILCENADGSIADFIFEHPADDPVLGGMTTFEVRALEGETTRTNAIVHCPSGQAMSYVQPVDNPRFRTINTLIDTSQNISLRQLARRMKRNGFEATYGQLSAGHCACQPETHKPSF